MYQSKTPPHLLVFPFSPHFSHLTTMHDNEWKSLLCSFERNKTPISDHSSDCLTPPELSSRFPPEWPAYLGELPARATLLTWDTLPVLINVLTLLAFQLVWRGIWGLGEEQETQHRLLQAPEGY